MHQHRRISVAARYSDKQLCEPACVEFLEALCHSSGGEGSQVGSASSFTSQTAADGFSPHALPYIRVHAQSTHILLQEQVHCLYHHYQCHSFDSQNLGHPKYVTPADMSNYFFFLNQRLRIFLPFIINELRVSLRATNPGLLKTHVQESFLHPFLGCGAPRLSCAAGNVGIPLNASGTTRMCYMHVYHGQFLCKDK